MSDIWAASRAGAAIFGAALATLWFAFSPAAFSAEPDSGKSRPSLTSVAGAELEIAAATLPPLSIRFGDDDVEETPDFQRHIGPLLGHLGCNGRACHGSFQGRGGFALSLFGYDFAADHAALTEDGSARVDSDDVAESLILYKPTDEERHEGGKRMDVDSWQYRVLSRWIAGGAAYSGELQPLQRVEITPAEIIFSSEDQHVPLRAIAYWADGTSEDVTDLCRFTTNDDAIAVVSEAGVVSSGATGDTHVVVAYDRAVVPVPVLRPASYDLDGVTPPPESTHAIDRLVQEKLDKLRIIPAAICSDADFIRRASLDLVGMLPSAERVERFLADRSPEKRLQLIEELLEQPGYAAWWATRLSDWTGNNEAELVNYLPVRGMATQLWFGWLQKRLQDNLPYDQIVEGIVTAESRMPEESYTQYCETMSAICRTGDVETFADRPGLPTFWARRNFRMTEERAIGFAYSFLGVRIQCAQCHKHPFDRWSKDDFDQFAVLFSPVRATPNNYARDSQSEMREMMQAVTDGKKLQNADLRRKVTQAISQGAVVPFPELTIDTVRAGNPRGGNQRGRGNNPAVRQGRILGEPESIAIQGDPRVELMRWLRDPENPYFAKAMVNRVWANYFGIGIVNPIDDLNLGNPPSNGPLLDYLAGGFIDSGFDLHWLHREIMTSDAYQRSSEPNVTNVVDTRNFSRHVPRRLPAEVLRDAVFLATSGSRGESSARTELTGLAISGEMTAGRRGRGDFALQIFGQSTRESNCDCDRSDQANLLQAIFLQNDTEVHQALHQRGGWVDEATANWPGSPSNGQANRGDNDRQQRIRGAAVREAQERMRLQFETRIKAFLAMPAQRQEKLRPQLKRELEQANRRRAQYGVAPLKLDEMIRQVRSGSDSKESVAADSVPQTAGRQTAEHSAVATVDQAAIRQAITGAYLRTLSRVPGSDELEAAGSFVHEADDPVAGLRSVVWALLNTKEFVLSH